MVLPFPARIFEKTSVSVVPGGDWVERFRKLWRETPKGDRIILHLPQTGDPYGTCNTRLVELATARGSFHLIALWDGKGGDGPGGTADLVAKARARADVPDIAAPLDLAP